jgi:hypothetical protein
MLLNKMVGAIVLKIDGLENESDLVNIHTDIGLFQFQHDQDCCEHVRMIDFEYDDMVGLVITTAEEPEGKQDGGGSWTFYKIEAAKDGKAGSLWMRWLGESNGFYSESVDIKFQPIKRKPI